MKKKEDKKKDIDALRQDLAKTQNLFVTAYEKLKVSQDFELRKVVRGAGANYRVVKNNLAELASEGTPAGQVLKDLKGMTSMAYTSADPVALAKALTAYAKANPTFTFKAGIVEGRVIDIKAIDELANMPSRWPTSDRALTTGDIADALVKVTSLGPGHVCCRRR